MPSALFLATGGGSWDRYTSRGRVLHVLITPYLMLVLVTSAGCHQWNPGSTSQDQKRYRRCGELFQLSEGTLPLMSLESYLEGINMRV